MTTHSHGRTNHWDNSVTDTPPEHTIIEPLGFERTHKEQSPAPCSLQDYIKLTMWLQIFAKSLHNGQQLFLFFFSPDAPMLLL